MHAIKATWTKGQIVPAEPVDWPEGSELLVEPLQASEKIGLDEAEWDDSPEAIAEWIAAVERIEPMVWAPGEREEYERFREEIRNYTVEAVGKQMEEMAGNDAP